MDIYRYAFVFSFLICFNAYGQQDITFHVNAHLLPGIKVLKVKRDFYDPYLWVLARNNQVYRVNSLTLAVDDFTTQFAAYNYLQFIDIAGRSKDTVFVASSSTNLIQYKSGVTKLIGTTDGITDNINSIGVDYSSGAYPTFRATILTIATGNNIYRYNMDTDQPVVLMDVGTTKLYEATYRTQMLADSNVFTKGDLTDTVAYLPVLSNGYGNLYRSFLWEGGKQFGYNIRTAYFTPGILYDFQGTDDPFNIDLFWGNDKGMFQVNDQFNNSANGHGYYLPGITVNKITSIYGLAAFGNGHQYGNPGLIQDNLLVGTNNGFYFSSSIYFKYGASDLRPLNLFHDDELGNVVINDICVDVASTAEPICEDGVWLAADDGLYLVKPDYSISTNDKQLSTLRIKNQPDTLTQLRLCSGESAIAIIDTQSYTGKSFRWYKDGSELAVQGTQTLIIKTAGDYCAVLYDPCTDVHVESNHIKVSIITSPIFSFDYPDKIQQCGNNPYTLTTDYNPSYHYRWYTNDILNGSTGNSFTVTQTGKYKVEVSACTNSWVPSKEVEVDLISLPIPQVTADKTVYCAEDVATLSVNTPVNPSYTINWYQDGNLITADNNLASIQTSKGGNYTVIFTSTIGTCTQSSAMLPVAFTPAPVFTFNYPDQLQYCTGTPLTLVAGGSNGYQYRWYKNDILNNITTASLSVTDNGSYKVEASSCTGSWVASKEVQVTFINLPVPVIVADKPAYCNGDIATLSLSEAVDPDLAIHWYKDNVLIPTSPGQTSIKADLPGNYTVSLVNNTTNTDGTNCSQTSAALALVFNPPPTVSIKEAINTTLCTGQTVSLTANYSGGKVLWSTGETTSQINVTQTGSYKVTVNSPAGCQADASIDVNFYPLPVFTVKDTSLCTYKKQVITLTGPTGFTGYDWNNGQSTGQTFQVSQPGIVSLTVTDVNGCQATQQIKVSEQCATVYIPNTFTPNGDGVNDTWVIEGLDETATVKVYTRWGSEVYQSVGYSSPWNGEYAGKKLVTGVYYYLVTAKNGAQKFSGSLTIIY